MVLLPRKGLLAIAAVVDVASQTTGRPISGKTLAADGLPAVHARWRRSTPWNADRVLFSMGLINLGSSEVVIRTLPAQRHLF